MTSLFISFLGMAFLVSVLWSLWKTEQFNFNHTPWFFVAAEIMLIGQTLYLGTSLVQTCKAVKLSVVGEKVIIRKMLPAETRFFKR